MSDQLKQELGELIEQLDLSSLQKQFMKSRWLDQLLWLESRAGKAQKRYYSLRLVTIIGGVIVPALISVNSASFFKGDSRVRESFGWAAFAVSQVVAVSAAIEELFHYGDNYRRYRSSAEALKIEGWNFLQLSGSYANLKSHAAGYPVLAGNVEAIIQKDVREFAAFAPQKSLLIQEKEEQQ